MNVSVDMVKRELGRTRAIEGINTIIFLPAVFLAARQQPGCQGHACYASVIFFLITSGQQRRKGMDNGPHVTESQAYVAIT